MLESEAIPIGRRAFLKSGTLVLAALGVAPTALYADEKTAVKFGLITDLHYADKPAAGTRFYRETLDKLAEAAKQFAKDQPTFLVELGDLIDAADSVETERAYLKRVNKVFAAICDQRHHVLGNHCVDVLTKDEFLGDVGQKKSYYSFDSSSVHFIVLDACFRADGKPYGRKNSKWNDANIPAAELDWLKEDLKATTKKTIVLAHQRLDVANDYGVKNAADIRKAFETSGKVVAVFQGHSHKNDYKEIGGIHYSTMVAMIEGTGVENNGYSTVTVKPDGSVIVTGFRKQQQYDWSGKQQ